MKKGDLVKIRPDDTLAIIVEVYPDLCIDDPWVRIYRLNENINGDGLEGGYQWIKMKALSVAPGLES